MSSSRTRVTRRDVLRGALAATALAACGRRSPSSAPAPADLAATPSQPRRILILGGSGFIGPKTIDAAIARGHHVTIFNRGKREKLQPLTQQVEHLYGNRDPRLPADEETPGSPVGLEQLAAKRWDVVIDNSGFFPRHVEASAKLLAPSAAQYIFISSISVYAEIPPGGGDETSKLAELDDPTVETMGDQFQHYGGLKVLCERAVTAAFGAERTTVVRPGYIVGPGDPTDRFTYWPVRIAAGGEVLAPGAPSDPLQWIDARDLAAWLVQLVEQRTAGTFNAVGPAAPARWGDVLQTCITASASKASLTWLPASWLDNQGVAEGTFPIWAPAVGESAGFHRWSSARARAAGLTLRPIADTVSDLLRWFPEELERRARVTRELVEAAQAKGAPAPKLGDPAALRAGPTRERERELLAAFHAGR
jgi:2'-hydroxyisoflavone reductase